MPARSTGGGRKGFAHADGDVPQSIFTAQHTPLPNSTDHHKQQQHHRPAATDYHEQSQPANFDNETSNK
eukprot:9488097-Pyramimonas_sp.AAC.1